MPAAGILMVLESRWWPLFGLVGDAMFTYLGCRGIAARVSMNRRGIRVEKAHTLIGNGIFLVMWGLSSAAMMAGAILASCT